MPDLSGCFMRTYPIDLPAGASFFHRGRRTGIVNEYGPEIIQNPPFASDRTSEDWVIVGDVAGGCYLLLGAVTARRSLTNLIVHREHSRLTRVTVYQPEIGSAADDPEELVQLEGDDWRELLVRYAMTALDRAGAKPPQAASNCAGYCSWYYHHHHVSEQQFMDAVTALARRRDAFPARYAQIDDGYQTAHGDWLSRNASWPSPLQETVRRVRDLGLEAGIWTMPLLAATSSKVFADHRDWFVRDRHGDPWVLRGWSPEPDHLWACLDFSRSDVCEHLRNVFATMYEWGFRYFKLDGWFVATNGVRSEPGATATAEVRTCLKLIRQAVGDSVVLGCGTPFLPSLGLVDHSRVSSDTGKTWRAWGLPTESQGVADTSQPCDPMVPSLENALHGSLGLWWMYDRWFRADPDCIMARDENTALTAGEARLSALSAIVTGVAITSDRLDRMGEDRVRLLALAAKTRLRGARPLDWKDNAWPRVFGGEVDGRPAAAIFNYSESPWEWRLQDLGLTAPAAEWLHQANLSAGLLRLAGHDGALVVGEG